MKNSLFIISKLCMLAFILLLAQGCQEDYEMIDPPLMTDYDDDLDEEVIMQKGLESYFVTQFGEGEMDGSSWEQALDVAGFRKLLSGSVDLSKSTIYMSQGKYVMSEESGLGVIVRKNVKAIKGGYSQFSEGTDVSARDIDTYVTVISGDVNGNKQADAGDCGLLLVKKGHITIEGVTFQYGYVSEADASTTECGSGIYVSGGAGDTSIELTDCVIRDCTSGVTTSAKQGGPAVFVLSGQVRLNNVNLLDNTAVGRGGAITTTAANSFLFMNNCLLHENYAPTAWGTAIHAGNGYVCMNNVTVLGTTATGGNSITVNGDAYFMLANTTIVGNSGNPNGVFRAGKNASLVVNSLFAKGAGNRTIYAGNITSGGYNVYQAADAGWGAVATDTDYSSQTLPAATLTDGVYQWTVTGTIDEFATKQAVIDAVKSFDATVGQQFINWVGENGFGVDQRGVARNVNKMQAGAYDAGL